MINIVYKYLPPDRISILQDFKIRLSQPPILNDPYEYFQFFDVSPSSLADLVNDNAQNNEINLPQELISKIGELLNSSTNKALSQKIGLISFSRTELNLLMWAHYASNYTGFVIGFDSSSSFFSSSIEGLTNQLQNVIYTTKRKQFDLNHLHINDGILCTKPIEWSYEEEIRFIDSISEEENNSQKDNFGYPVVLRNFQKDMIIEIIIGLRSKQEKEILSLVHNNELQANIYKLQIEPDTYKLFKRKIS